MSAMQKVVMMQQCAVASTTAFQAVAPWGCGMHSWIRKCVPVYPTYAPQEDADPSGTKAGGQGGSGGSTQEQKKTEKPNVPAVDDKNKDKQKPVDNSGQTSNGDSA